MSSIEIPTYNFNKKTAPVTSIEGILAYALVPSRDYWQIIKKLANEINPLGKVNIINLHGAKKSYIDLQGEWSAMGRFRADYLLHEVRYASTAGNPESGFVEAKIPISSQMVEGQDAFIWEDMGDSVKCVEAMTIDALRKGALSVAVGLLALKTPHRGQVRMNFAHVGFKMAYRAWGGGAGFDFGTPEVPTDFPRSLDGVVVRIDPKDLTKVKRQLDRGTRKFIAWQDF